MQTILAIDDEGGIRQSYRMVFAEQYRVLLAESGEEALGLLDENHVDVVLLDLMMPGMGGMGFLDEMSRRGELTPVIVVTALNSVSTAVEATKRGARDYVIKPFDVDGIMLTVERALSEQRERQELEVLREADRSGFECLIGESHALLRALNMARQAMQVDSTVLITGESGTGKDLVARANPFGRQTRGEDLCAGVLLRDSGVSGGERAIRP